MRTKAAGAQAILANPSHGGLVVVNVYQGANPNNLATYFGVDPALEVSIQEDVDNPRTATVRLQRQQGARSLAPLVTTGNPVAGLVGVGRRIVITGGVVPPDSEAYYELPTLFDGYIDAVDWPDDVLTLTCTDKFALLRDTWIEVERAYGFATGASATKGTLVWAANAVVAVNDLVVPSQANGNGHFYKVTGGSGAVGSTEPTWPTGSGATVALGGITYTEVGAVSETGTAVETVIQQVLNDNGLGSLVTLQTPVSPSWLIRPYIQQRTSVADAIKGLVDQLGWRCRFDWSSGLGRYELTLKQPNRSATTPDKVVLATEELKTNSLAVDVFSIRNVVRVTYSDTAARTPAGVVPRKFVEVSDSASITKYGRRYMEITEADTSQIDSSTEAQRMAQGALDDLKEPALPMGVVFPLDPYLEIGDLVQLPADNLRFSSAQVLAVDALTHRWGEDATTEVRLRGKPASQRAGWLELDGRLKPEDVHQVSPLETVGATVSTVANVVGGVSIILTYSLMKGGTPPGVEVHISPSGGFTPDASTLKAYGQASSFTIAQLVPGKTYYGRLVPYTLDAGGAMVRGQPGAEFTFAAGRAQAGHYSSTATQSHLPLNGNFEHATDDLATAPPDQWAITGGSWGSAGSVYYGSAAPVGKFITLRAVASGPFGLVSSLFEVRRGVTAMMVYVSARAGGATGVDLNVTLEGFDDSAMTTTVFTQTFTMTTSGVGNWDQLAKASNAIPASCNFMRVTLNRASASATVSWDVGDVYVEESHPGEFWAPVTFDTGWQNYDNTTYFGAAYCKDQMGFIHLRGIVKTTTQPDATHRTTSIFTLPTGFRPLRIAILPIRVNLSPVSFATLYIGTDGVVKLDGYTVAQPESAVCLDGITFDTRQGF